MHMVTVVLCGPGNAALSADVLDVLWVVASFEDGVEHLHAGCPEGGGLGYLTFFLTAPTWEAAVVSARGMARRALESAPVLNGWHLMPGCL
ncbi:MULTISPECIES: hypothetical protein [unclassified Streptomyces]|uniref:hypothetical protein n=1 Tax=unclassified Streptomyces TaxID=2593676 RepID=UPI003D765561